MFFGPIGKTRWPPWPLIGWDIFDFSSETAERNSTKLDRKQDLNVLYQVCVFFSGRSEKQDGRPGLWLAETFSTSPLKPLNPIQQNLIGSKISKPSTKFVFFGPIGKTRWPPRSLIGRDIFDFSVETAEWNSTNLDRKQDLNIHYQVCVFRADQKNKMAALASDWLRHFRLLWNRWTEFNETWQEARSQRPLPSLCFSGRSEKQDGRPGLWLAETFSTSPLKPLNEIQRNLTRSKISMSSTKFVFFGPIRKTRWPPWPLIGRDIFDFSSETAKPNSLKFDRKQDLKALYQVCVFRADRKNKMAAPVSDWLRHFRLLLWNRWTEFNETWQEARSQRPLPSLCFSGRSEKQDGHLASDWLRYFRLLLWNSWMEFNETYKESRSKRPLPRVCFTGRSEKQDGRPGRKVNKNCHPGQSIKEGGTLYSGARYGALWASCLWIYLGEVRGGAPIHVYVWEHIVSLY